MEWNEIKPIAVSQSNYYGVLRTVYYPGLACSNWRRHMDRAADTTYGFIMGDGRVICPKCLSFELAREVVTNAVDKIHWMPRHWNDEIRKTWKDTTAKKYWTVMKMLGLIDQIKIITYNNSPLWGNHYTFDVLLHTRERDIPKYLKQGLFKVLLDWGVQKLDKADEKSWEAQFVEAEQRLTYWRNNVFRTWVMIETLFPYPENEEHDRIMGILLDLMRQLKYRPLTENQHAMLMAFEAQELHARIDFTKYQCELVMAQ